MQKNILKYKGDTMKFQDFQNIIKELEEKKYLYCDSYNQHIFVELNSQEDKELENIIREKIDNLWSMVEGYKGHKIKTEDNTYIGEVFVSTNNIVNIIRNEDSYEKMKEKIKDNDLIYVMISGKGVDKKLELDPHNTYFKGSYYRGHHFDACITEAIKQSLPENIHVAKGYRLSSVYIQTDKAQEWEQKKINCKEIQINNDFDEILKKYNIEEE